MATTEDKTPAQVLQEQMLTLIKGIQKDLDSRAPTKRAVKLRGGGSNRKQYQGRKAKEAVGGTTDIMKAIYSPADTALCNIVDHRVGMRDGVPFRTVGMGAQSSGAQRG